MSDNFIYGWHPVSELIRGRPRDVQQLYVADSIQPQRLAELQALVREHGVRIESISKQRLEIFVGRVTHQGIAARVPRFNYADIDDILKVSPTPLLVALDQVQDPHNLGSLIRSAYALGAHGLVIPKDRACEVKSTVIKSSAGAAAHLPIARVTNLKRALDDAKKAGLWVVGTVAEGGQALGSIDFKQGIVLVIGSEGEGMRRTVTSYCDFLAHIPMAGALGSLNASVAGAICLYEAMRQRTSIA